MVELRKRQAWLGAHARAPGIHAASFHRREIDHQPVVDHRLAGDVVATSTRRDGEPVRLRESHGRDDVGRTATAHDQSRPMVDHRVEELPRLIVGRIVGHEHGASNGRSQILERCWANHVNSLVLQRLL
jgi:hypothetical protein